MKAALLVAGALALIASSASAAENDVVIRTPGQVQWTDAAQFGKGVKTAVLAGDPSKDGPYVMRIMFPAATLVPSHTHGKAENVTVMSGTLALGMGEHPDKSKATPLPAGSFFRIPANTPHFAVAESDTIVQVNGMGPSTITMVEPATGNSSPSK
jgi:quercetin dioxygenase-like cupin family protein